MKARLLIVDDDPGIVAALQERFAARGFDISTAETGKRAIELARSTPDVILLDLQLPEGDGMTVLDALRAERIESTVIVITAYGTVRKAVEAMAAGAYDFVEKPFDPSLVEETVQRAIERSSLVRENQLLREQVRGRNLVVADPRMQEVMGLAEKAARSASTVLLLGESGTGKELLARQIHDWSPRAAGPFVAINCVGIAETLLESELFGHEKGAFTGATARKRGKFELAQGGTLLLDEIGDVSPSFQAKLLRFLQERTFERVGGTTTIRADVRCVAATNRDLTAMVKAGEFREDLFYRLNVIAISLPPLRDRPADIEVLARQFIQLCAAESGRTTPTISDAAMSVLRGYSWPGNVRELRNAVERAVALSEEDVLHPSELLPDIDAASAADAGGSFHQSVEQFRRNLIVEALARCDGNQTRAAEHLGLQRTYLARLIRKYAIS